MAVRRRVLAAILILGLICRPASTFPQNKGDLEELLEDAATAETAVVRQVSIRRSNAIPRAPMVKIANLTRQHEGDEFQAHGKLNKSLRS